MIVITYDFSKIDNYEELRKLQLTQLEILKYVDEFCNEHKLRYSIAYGTLLGAARHNGYIPWDDDLDICMPREDYEKFLSLWKDTDLYLLQNHDTDRDFPQGFTKIRKNNTAFIQETDVGKNFHKGVFIDIFPYDRVPDGKIKRKIQVLHAMFHQLYNRGFAPTENGFIYNIGCKLILFFTPKKKYYAKSKAHLKKICKYNNDKNLKYFSISSFVSMHKYYPANIFDNITKVKYEDIYVSAFGDYDTILKEFYGDYMKLPPESEQTWSHHPILIDFEKNH